MTDNTTPNRPISTVSPRFTTPHQLRAGDTVIVSTREGRQESVVTFEATIMATEKAKFGNVRLTLIAHHDITTVIVATFSAGMNQRAYQIGMGAFGLILHLNTAVRNGDL